MDKDESSYFIMGGPLVDHSEEIMKLPQIREAVYNFDQKAMLIVTEPINDKNKLYEMVATLGDITAKGAKLYKEYNIYFSHLPVNKKTIDEIKSDFGKRE